VKAFLLAAGLGTRLRPLTSHQPKCLVPIRGRPLLGYWLGLCRQHGVGELLINTHLFPEAIRRYLAEAAGGLKLHVTFEPHLLGSAGTVRENRWFVGEEEAFFILYSDNLTDANLSAMEEFHRRHGGPLTMGLFRAERPEACGIATLDSEGRVVAFHEKPRHPAGNLANAGIYLAGPEVFRHIPEEGPADFGFDVLPRMVGRMYGFVLEGFHLDIGTPEHYARANAEWPH
jgi:mannose-1-phosphate guanylyltransferase